jgi:hypothetical protein
MQRRLCLLLSVVGLLLAPPALLSQGAADIQLKARLAMAVARFAERTDAPASNVLRFCVAAKGNAVPKAFAELGGQRLGNRTVEIVSTPPANDCDILYVMEGVPDWQARMTAAGARALTIGDVAGFIVGGGMVELVIENDALRFDVNLEAARERHIRMPGQVLKLARRVRE